MVDQCGNLLRGPPSIFAPYQKYCFNPAFSTEGDDTFTPCVRSKQGLHARHPAQGRQFQAKGGGVPSGLPVDFTPVMASVGGPAGLNAKCGSKTPYGAASSKVQCKTPIVTTMHDGTVRHTCAVPVAQNISQNCTSTMKSVWQCDRFLARGDVDGYNKCKAMEKCFQYDVKMPDGTVLPMTVTSTDMCLAAADMALKQAAPNCVNGRRKTCTAQPPY